MINAIEFFNRLTALIYIYIYIYIYTGKYWSTMCDLSSSETTVKCVSVGPAHCRERLQNPVRFSSASIQQSESHLVGPEQALVNGTRGRYSLKEGGNRDGSSSQKKVRVLQPVLHSSKEGWRVASHFRSASVWTAQSADWSSRCSNRSCLRSSPRTGLSRSI